MTSRSNWHNNPADDSKAAADQLLNTLFKQAKAQFGDAVKSFWFYDGDLCPACMARPIGVVKFKGKNALAINAFIYRERGVLIGYFLCEICAKFIFKEAQRNPYKQTPLHTDIERNLTAAYQKHLASLDA
ncbi:MAG TPA: hypothetical protein VJ022_00190 [Anaerolineales bacterium]|nr:hypothetical protein [Anaerolineales bacterium]